MMDAAEIRRCQHIKTNGTQCGSPALRNRKFCYHHQECRPERVKVRGSDGKTSQILVPMFEDAHSIQVMVRQVVMLMLEDRIDDKKAGRVLYALRIAAANLPHMEAAKPRPVQVVVDPKQVGETPLEMTPWSWSEEGHEREDISVGFQGEMAARLKQEVIAVRERLEDHQYIASKIANEMNELLRPDAEKNYEGLRQSIAIQVSKIEEDLTL